MVRSRRRFGEPAVPKVDTFRERALGVGYAGFQQWLPSRRNETDVRGTLDSGTPGFRGPLMSENVREGTPQ